jgi:intergrase/recombinase
MKQDRLKTIISEISEYVYNGYVFPVELLKEMHEIYCSTCGSCGKLECCPPNKCKFGLDYISNLNKQIEDLKKENKATRKALDAYIKKAGWKTNEDIINQEIEFYGK